MAGQFSSEDIAMETAEFVEFLYSLATREHGDTGAVPLAFSGREIDVEFILVAKPAVYAAKGSDPYCKAVEWSLQHARRSVYLLARGRNCDHAREVAENFAADERIRSLERWQSDEDGHDSYAEISVIRLNVDLRLLTSIGYQPLVAVGPGKQREIAGRQWAARQAVWPRPR